MARGASASSTGYPTAVPRVPTPSALGMLSVAFVDGPGGGVETPLAMEQAAPSDQPIVPSDSMRSGGSGGSKKRAPVPPLRDRTLEDAEQDQTWEEECNFDINPTPMFLVLASKD